MAEIDEMHLLYDFANQASRTVCAADVDAIWRELVAPARESLSEQTMDQLSRLYSLRVSTLKAVHEHFL